MEQDPARGGLPVQDRTGRPARHSGIGRWVRESMEFRLAVASALVIAILAGVSVVLARHHGSSSSPQQQQTVAPPGSMGATAGNVPTTAASPSPTTDPTVAALLKADQDELHAFLHASGVYGGPSDPNDPLLVQTTTGEQLSTIKKNLIIDRAEGTASRGDIQILSSRVVSVTGTTAVVSDCQYSTLIGYYVATGKMIPGSDRYIPLYSGVRSTFTQVAGVWRMSDSYIHDGTCAGF